MGTIKISLIAALTLGLILVVYELVVPSLLLGGGIAVSTDFVLQVLITVGLWTIVGLVIIASYIGFEWLISTLRAIFRRILHHRK